MKKVIVIIVLIIVLLSMSSAYAVWRDSVSINVSASSAVLRLNYTARNAGNMFTSSPALPASQVSESISGVKVASNNNGSTVIYTITNQCEYNLILNGIDVLSKSVVVPNGAPAGDYEGSIVIEYTLENAATGYYDHQVITDFTGHSGITFSSSPVCFIAANGGECTLTVEYYRVTLNDKKVDKQKITINKTDKLNYSVYR